MKRERDTIKIIIIIKDWVNINMKRVKDSNCI